jgi:hypothetical protein
MYGQVLLYRSNLHLNIGLACDEANSALPYAT